MKMNHQSKCLSVIKNSNVPEIPKVIPTWSGCNSLISVKNLDCKKVGFCPIIPHPVTKIETVYTCQINFKKISATLKQKALSIFCDEGVY